MRAVVQRVSQGAVEVDGDIVGRIGPGLLVLLGVAADDAEKDADVLAGKIVNLRIFEDEAGKLNRSLVDCGGEILVVSQFTLYGDCRKGRRPSFVKAAAPEKGRALYHRFVEALRARRLQAATGRFGAMMAVSLVNQGPVTLIVESR
jgi:D-tyrosyl-tRNA(Tyr) deacylase